MFSRSYPRIGAPGSETDPIPVEDEKPDLSAINWGDLSWVYVKTPSGRVIKCYYSYSDYCDD